MGEGKRRREGRKGRRDMEWEKGTERVEAAKSVGYMEMLSDGNKPTVYM